MVQNDRSWYVMAVVGGKMCRFLLDTGCTHSCMSWDMFQQLDAEAQSSFQWLEKPGRCTGFSGETAPIVGQAQLEIAVPGKKMMVQFIVVDAPVNCILGIDFMEGYSVQLDYDNQLIWCREANLWSSFPDARMECHVAADVLLPPRAECKVAVRVSNAIQSAPLMVEGGALAEHCKVVVARMLVQPDAGNLTTIRVMNPHETDHTIRKGVCVAQGQAAVQVAVPVPMLLVEEGDTRMYETIEARPVMRKADHSVDSYDSYVGEPQPTPAELRDAMKGEVPPHLTNLFVESATHLDTMQRCRLAQMLNRFQSTTS